MAARLTDKQKKKIIADYIQMGSYAAVARKHKINDHTVKKIVDADPDFARKSEQKKEENAADVLAYMESQKNKVCTVLGICLDELMKPERYAKIPPPQIATTMAILIDKYTMDGIAKMTDEQAEDPLSAGLRELAEKGIESDE